MNIIVKVEEPLLHDWIHIVGILSSALVLGCRRKWNFRMCTLSNHYRISAQAAALTKSEFIIRTQ